MGTLAHVLEANGLATVALAAVRGQIERLHPPRGGAQLHRIVHVDTFWFAWAAFLPQTKVVPAVPAGGP